MTSDNNGLRFRCRDHRHAGIIPSQLRAFDFYDSSFNESHLSHLSFQRLFRRLQEETLISVIGISFSPPCLIVSSDFVGKEDICIFSWDHGQMRLVISVTIRVICTLHIVEEFISFNLVKSQHWSPISCTNFLLFFNVTAMKFQEWPEIPNNIK